MTSNLMTLIFWPERAHSTWAVSYFIMRNLMPGQDLERGISAYRRPASLGAIYLFRGCAAVIVPSAGRTEKSVCSTSRLTDVRSTRRPMPDSELS